MHNKLSGRKKRDTLQKNYHFKKNGNPSVFLLKMLLSAAPNYLSGSEIATALKMSRVGVWSRVNNLRKNGISIEATQNLGYRFAGEPNFIEENLINAWLEYIKCNQCLVDVREKVSSTNSEIEKSLPDRLSKVPIAIISNEQTNGKGRFTKKWSSPKGGNIYMSVGFKPNVDVIKLRYFTLLQGIEIARLLQKETNTEDVKIKWPNDIFLNGKKIGGMLTEASIDCENVNSLTFGFGLNVNNTPRLVQNHFGVSSMKQELGTSFLLNEITAKIIKVTIKTYRKCILDNLSTSLFASWKQFDFLYKKQITLLSGKKEIQGIAYGIDDAGGLKLKLKNGRIKVFHAGEITVKK